MEKKHVIKFLHAKKRGVYTLLVEMYADVIMSMAITMALEIIQEDLEKDSGEKVVLNYFSLAQAAAKFKKYSKDKPSSRKKEFKDVHEEGDTQNPVGTFTLGQ
jgi:hypothetical protein